MSAPRLCAEGEAAWLRLKTHLEWCDGFALVYLFSDQPGVVELFRERLADIHRARVTRLRQYEPRTPDDLNPGLLLRLLEPGVADLALNAPLWVDLSAHPQAPWPQARLELLARLNEQRERLRTRQQRPVVLVLPAAERAALIAIAPDLWSIRQFTLATGPWLAPDAAPAAAPTVLAQPFALSSAQQSAVDEWRRLRGRGAADAGALRAGWAAWLALYEQRHLAEAEAVAAQVLALARGLGESPEALRDLSVCLDKVGLTARALGRWEEARAAYKESLDLSRRLLERIGATPEALRDLSVSLDNVGGTAQALGRWEEARAAYAESLDLRRRLLERVSETPEALRDLSLSLNNMGRTAQALGRREEARQAFTEALSVAERLAEALPELPDYATLPDHFRARLADLAGAPP